MMGRRGFAAALAASAAAPVAMAEAGEVVNVRLKIGPDYLDRQGYRSVSAWVGTSTYGAELAPCDDESEILYRTARKAIRFRYEVEESDRRGPFSDMYERMDMWSDPEVKRIAAERARRAVMVVAFK